MSSRSDEILKVARNLVSHNKPSKEEIARSISATYYAIFHFLRSEVSNVITREGGFNENDVKTLVCSASSHTNLFTRLSEIGRFRPNNIDKITQFSILFCELYLQRIEADYLWAPSFDENYATELIERTEIEIRNLSSLPNSAKASFFLWLFLIPSSYKAT